MNESPIRTSVETDKLDAAMADAQAELENPIKGKTANLEGTSKTSGKDYKIGYAYADIADILADCRPILAKHKIALYQVPLIDSGAVVIVTRLACAGQWIEGDYPVCRIGGDHQDMGKAMTYARRYALGAMIGIAPEKDTDGAGAAMAGGPDRDRPLRNGRQPLAVTAAESSIIMCMTVDDLKAWGKGNAEMIDALPSEQIAKIKETYNVRMAALKAEPKPAPDNVDAPPF